MMSPDIISEIDAAVAAENTALGFFTGASGAAVSAAWFGAQWRLARARRPALLRELRERAVRG